MPLHVDVKLNEDKNLSRINIARMTRKGLSKESVNEYAVVVSEIRRAYDKDWPYSKEEFTTPSESDYDTSTIRFEHRYGDDELVCVMKALQALRPEQFARDAVIFNITNQDEIQTEEQSEDKTLSQNEADAMVEAAGKARSGGTRILGQMIFNLKDKLKGAEEDKIRLLDELSESEKIREDQKIEIAELKRKLKTTVLPQGKIPGARTFV